MPKAATNTTLGDFQRRLREEPHYLIYKHKLYFNNSTLSADLVASWLQMRYAESRRGHRYRLVTYSHRDGNRYVDYILMETLKEKDELEMKMRGWTYSFHKVARTERTPRRKLTKEQRAQLDDMIAEIKARFYDLNAGVIESE